MGLFGPKTTTVVTEPDKYERALHRARTVDECLAIRRLTESEELEKKAVNDAISLVTSTEDCIRVLVWSEDDDTDHRILRKAVEKASSIRELLDIESKAEEFELEFDTGTHELFIKKLDGFVRKGAQ